MWQKVNEVPLNQQLSLLCERECWPSWQMLSSAHRLPLAVTKFLHSLKRRARPHKGALLLAYFYFLYHHSRSWGKSWLLLPQGIIAVWKVSLGLCPYYPLEVGIILPPCSFLRLFLPSHHPG